MAESNTDAKNKARTPGDAQKTVEAKAKPKKTAKKAPPEPDTAQDTTKKYVAVIAIIVIIIIFAGAIVYGVRTTKPATATLSQFESHFEAANAIGIYAIYTNNASFASAIGCSTSLTEAITEPGAMHKNPEQIHYFILNSTACTYSVLGPNATTITTSIDNCTSFAASHPSIFINYSNISRTTITNDSIYISGNESFLSICGIANEIS